MGSGSANIINTGGVNAIVNGIRNTIQPTVNYGIIGNGERNTVATGATHAGIFSGFSNTVSAKMGAILGGQENTVTGGSSMIGGGDGNTVNGALSGVVSGDGNTVDGAFSAVLGGSGNLIGAAYNHAGVFGQNVAAQASNTFHVECLNAINTPLGPGLFPPGTVYHELIPTLPPPYNACKFLFLQ